MAALAIPISELTPVVVEAKAETRRVVCYSKADTSKLNFGVAWDTLRWTLRARRRFATIVMKQDRLIGQFVERDFSQTPAAELHNLAVSVTELLNDERNLLSEAGKLGSEIRVWWSTSLLKLADQIEHLDSIAESLHAASDQEITALLAMSVDVAMHDAEVLAIK